MATNPHQQRRSNNSDANENDVPMELVFPKSSAKCRLKRGRFLGKGTFACCFEFIDTVSEKSYAVKTIPQKVMEKRPSSYERIIQEVTIHGSLDHKNVVRLLEYFEKDRNVYMVMELCSERSMMELMQSRHTVTEVEARFFMTHIVSGLVYLHENKVIHRDIKLGNLLICENMVVKIADFGLAIYESELGKAKYDKCGTPNYISPEMLNTAGYSYPIDIWATGVVLFTLLSGTPPFETDNIDKTYKSIKSGTYNFSPVFGSNVRSLIGSLLNLDPSQRPPANQICKHAFFTQSYCPKQLPRSSMVATPRIKKLISGGTITLDESMANKRCQTTFQLCLLATRKQQKSRLTTSMLQMRSTFRRLFH
ncbi:Polo-like kinase [Aphelenchoides bicaudatus]|nr:Polo-like kinase [Aphelenchoides bicaudatus]